MAPLPKLAVNRSNDGVEKKDLDELHLAEASNAVTFYGICIAFTALLLAVGGTLCFYCLGLAMTLSAATTLGLLAAVSLPIDAK